MKIKNVKVHNVSAPLSRRFWMSLEPYSGASELIVRIETDTGLVGIGEIHGRPLEQIEKILLDTIGPMLLGEDPMDHERHWSSIFALTHTRAGYQLSRSEGQPHFGAGARPQIMAAIAGIDIALWDLKGKIAGQPVYKLLGGSRNTVDCYASGGYYGPDGEAAIDDLAEEMASYMKLGYAAVKMKVGGLSIEEDVERVAKVREVIGPDTGLMLDANIGYSVPDAIHAAKAFESFDIAWFEEPVHWYDSVYGLRQVSDATSIPIVSGESELHRWACRDLIQHGGIRFMQFDSTRAGGVTEWTRVANMASAHGIQMAPHHDPQIHGHLVAAVPNGHILEVFPNAVRDPLWDKLYVGKPDIKNGILYVPDRPGFGYDIDPEALKEFAA